MPRARFVAAVLSLCAGVMLLGGALVLHEPVAEAAPRRTVKQVRRTARRSNESPSFAKGAAEAGPTKNPPEAAATAKGSSDPAAATAPPEAATGAKGAPATEKSTGTKGVSEKSPGTAKSPAETATSAKSAPEAAPIRNGDSHASAAKAPIEAASSAKSATEPSSGDVASSTGAAPAARPVVVSFDGPVFDNGDVPRAAAALDRLKGAFARCASTETALSRNEASIDLRFLVRAPGRAEGVDVEKARGMSGDVVRCMTSVLARSYVGPPSDDPVGVAVTVRMRKD